MDIKKLIIKTLDKKGEVKASEIVKATGFSRAYVNRFFRELREEGILTLVGKANTARYIPAEREIIDKTRGSIKKTHKILSNDGLNEDKVLERIKKETGIFLNLPKNISNIVDYTFTEMLNNAIEHSRSRKIEVWMNRERGKVSFEVRDKGIGIFANLMEKKNLNDEMEAIQDLLKGKQTTEPASHSGEGIFFTSKAGDILTIQSASKKIIFDNLVSDVFVKNNTRNKKGTRVVFAVSIKSKKTIGDIFGKYTDDSYKFNKTEVIIKLFQEKANYVSRSQARRLLSGLEKFKSIILDFQGINTIGQAFADEIFRIWAKKHPSKRIIAKNAGENVLFMIKRAQEIDK